MFAAGRFGVVGSARLGFASLSAAPTLRHSFASATTPSQSAGACRSWAVMRAVAKSAARSLGGIAWNRAWAAAQSPAVNA